MTNPHSVLIFGRQPQIGLAEAEALFGSSNVMPYGAHTALIDLPPSSIDFSRLGGSTRLCQVIATIPSARWETVISKSTPHLMDLIRQLPEGKIRLGLSYLGNNINPRTLNASGLSIKKIIKAAGHSIRLIPNPAAELNTAQVLHNQLTGPTGIELVFIPVGDQTVVARTIAVQDINAYAARDQKRPKRDARVGMLPPKLAQIIVNLAVGNFVDPSTSAETIILDPFCGTGVVLQEALLMGYQAYGTDLEPRMIEFSQVNLDWLAQKHADIQPGSYNLSEGDATRFAWKSFDFIAGETYLGRALSGLPPPDKLAEIMSDCDTIHRKFLRNLAQQTNSGFRACIAVPAWKTNSGFKHLKTLANLHELGYNRVRFVHVSTTDLIYHRPEQLVARELVILERI